MAASIPIYRYDTRSQVFGRLSDARFDFDCQGKVALLKASDADIFLCLGCAGTVPEEALKSHMKKNHKLVIQENAIDCKTCRCVAGIGTEAANMHFHSTRHAGVVRAKAKNYCLQCCSQVPAGVKHGHPHVTSFQSICDDSNVENVAQAYKADPFVRTVVARGQKISQVKTHIEKTALALVALAGCKVTGAKRGTKQAASPALCEEHLKDMGFDRAGSSPGYEIILARMPCKACQGVERLAGQKADDSRSTFHILVKIDDMKDKPTPAKVVGAPVEVEPADFPTISKKYIHLYSYDPVKQKFVRPTESDGSDYEFDEPDGAASASPARPQSPAQQSQEEELSDDEAYEESNTGEQA